ncbi:MAG: hypothetical protein OEM81_08800 [Acidimicrobiia bacterium]|nr:hypothetical protein [Acidimicrobiia bacterium]
MTTASITTAAPTTTMAAPELTLPTGTELSAFESDFNEVIAATVAADGEHERS